MMNLLVFFHLINQIYEVLSASSIGYDRKIESATIYKDEIFFADAVDSTIKKCNKNICNNITILRNNTSNLYFKNMFLFFKIIFFCLQIRFYH